MEIFSATERFRKVMYTVTFVIRDGKL